jgi:hypothetical protein
VGLFTDRAQFPEESMVTPVEFTSDAQRVFFLFLELIFFIKRLAAGIAFSSRAFSEPNPFFCRVVWS